MSCLYSSYRHDDERTRRHVKFMTIGAAAVVRKVAAVVVHKSARPSFHARAAAHNTWLYLAVTTTYQQVVPAAPPDDSFHDNNTYHNTIVYVGAWLPSSFGSHRPSLPSPATDIAPAARRTRFGRTSASTLPGSVDFRR